MLHRAVDRFLERQRWLEPLADFVQKIAAAIYKGTAGHALKSFLNGTWLGHPLHPVITDIPVGAWTLAILFDLIHLANRGSAVWIDGATLLVGVGVLAALGAWVTGYTDWSDTYDRERRFGIAHALLMSTALVLYIVSFFLRLPVAGHAFAIILSWIGYVLVITAAYLGGELVFNIGTGVNHHAWQTPPTEWTPALRESMLTEGKPQKADVDGTPIFFCKRGTSILAISNTCAHAGGPLNEGPLQGDVITCPWHGSRFDIRTGAVKGGPATVAQVRYETRVQAGQVEVRRAPDSLQPS